VLFLAFWSALEEKVGWVLKSSGNFLSNKHKNIIILWRNGWEKWGKRCLPPLKCEKPPKYLYFDKNVSFASKTLLTSRIHHKTVEAYIIKWTTSSEPPVGLKSQQDSKWGHSWTIHYFTNLLPPCNILEFLIIHCLRNTALKKTMHHLYIPCPPTTPSTQAGADRLLIQCLQSVHLEVHLGVHNENLQHLYRTPPPTTSWQVRTGANNIPPIVVYLLSTMKSCITCFYHATIPWPPSTPRVLMQCLHSVHLEKKISKKWCLVAAAKHSLKWSFCLVKSASKCSKTQKME